MRDESDLIRNKETMRETVRQGETDSKGRKDDSSRKSKVDRLRGRLREMLREMDRECERQTKREREAAAEIVRHSQKRACFSLDRAPHKAEALELQGEHIRHAVDGNLLAGVDHLLAAEKAKENIGRKQSERYQASALHAMWTILFEQVMSAYIPFAAVLVRLGEALGLCVVEQRLLQL